MVRIGAQGESCPPDGVQIRCRFTRVTRQGPCIPSAASERVGDGSAGLAADGHGSGGGVVERSAPPHCELILGAISAEVPLDLHAALRTMRRGEIASFTQPDARGYGGEGEGRTGVPRGGAISLLVELLAWRWAPADTPAAGKEAAGLRARGASLYGDGRWTEALDCFTRAALRLEEARPVAAEGSTRELESSLVELDALRVSCLTSQALCHYKLGSWQASEHAAAAALRSDAACTKARYLRGVARMRGGDAASALADLRHVATVEPRSHDARVAYDECKALLSAIDARDRRVGPRVAAAWSGEPSRDDQTAPTTGGLVGFEPSLAASPPAVEEATAGDRAQYETERVVADARLDGNEGNLILDPRDQRMKYRSMAQMGADLGRYTWGQSEREITITVRGLPGATRAEHVAFRTTSTTLELAVHGKTVLGGALHAPIVSDESHYQLEDDETVGHDGMGARVLTASLTKLRATKACRHWPSVVVGEPTIDTSAFGAPVIAIDENSNDDVQRYMQILQDAAAGVAPTSMPA